MGILKLPRYMKLPGGIEPSIRLKSGDISPYVILTNTNEIASKVAKRLSGARLLTRGSTSEGFADTSIYIGEYKGLKVTVACSGIGSGITSTIMEELINIGAKVLLQVGATGALQPDIELGDIIIPVGAVRDEGTTPYYFPLNYPALADYRLVYCQVKAATTLGYRFHVGIVRTTDGFYASQRIEEYVQKWHAAGVLGVEQEVASIMIVSSYRRVIGGATLGVLGNLITGKHVLQGDLSSEEVNRIYDKVIDVNLLTLELLNEMGVVR